MKYYEGKRVLITGSWGFLGSHLVEKLPPNAIVFRPKRSEFDLRLETDVEYLFKQFNDIDILIHLAADVGGIGYNQNNPYQLFFNNAIMGINLIDYAIRAGVRKFVQLGTVCAYPKFASVPFQEKTIWNGYPEETNAPYGLAKKMLLVQLQAAKNEFDFKSVYLLPTNLYGPRDEFGEHRSHVIPALIKKCVEAKENDLDHIEVWGTGDASRDFLYVEDAADAIWLATEKFENAELINIGSGNEVRITALLYLIMDIVGYKGSVVWDTTKPDGQPRRKLDVYEMRKSTGWIAQTALKDGLKKTIEWYLQNK